MRQLRRLPRFTAPLLVLLGWAATAQAATPGYVYNFLSAPRLHPPKLRIHERRPGLARGDFLVANLSISSSPGAHPVGGAGPLILDSRLRPIWVQPVGLDSGETLDFQQETYHRRPVLIWVEGHTLMVVNQHYRTVATLQSPGPWTIDGHEASIVGGNVWVTVVRSVPQNLTSYGGPRDGLVIDSGVQEYNLATHRLLRTWDALNPGGRPNVPLSDSEQPLTPQPWDAYHLNAVQPLPDGDLLISMRDTWGVYLINPVTDRVLWTLGGKDSTFSFGQGARFAWQHDAKLVEPGHGGHGSRVELTLFNDDCCVETPRMRPGPPNGPSEGMVLDLDTLTRQVSLVAAYSNGPPGHTGFLGSMQLLPGGNALVGWGSNAYFSEFSPPSGAPLLNAQWPGSDQSYRTLFTDTWVGTPLYPPSGAVRGLTVYASWNGATQVASWEVLSGSHGAKVVASHARAGFQTALPLHRRYHAYRVRALSEQGTVLGTSGPFS